MARWHDNPLPPLPPLPADGIRRRIRLGQNEMWCRTCGGDNPLIGLGHGDYDIDRACLHCGSTDLVPTDRILDPDEYVVCQ